MILNWERLCNMVQIIRKDQIKEMTSDPFRLDVIQSLALLQHSNCFKEKELLLSTPLWYNSHFKLQINPQWHEKGIMVLGD